MEASGFPRLTFAFHDEGDDSTPRLTVWPAAHLGLRGSLR
jgi:hypothetical protein